MIAGDICCQKKQTEPILAEGGWSYDDCKSDTFTVIYDREGTNGLTVAVWVAKGWEWGETLYVTHTRK